MAALIKHVLSNTTTSLMIQCRHKSRRALPRKKVWLNPIKPGKSIESVVTGIAARGFLRPLKAYSPPSDVVERCQAICSKTLGPKVDDSTSFTDAKSTFTILNECFIEFRHSVPNSLLHTIGTVGDLKNFYQTPISTTTPLEKLRTIDLPENLHVQYEPIRFHPETDTKFEGQTAFPKRNTIVTGLRAKKKYTGYIYPDNYCRE